MKKQIKVHYPLLDFLRVFICSLIVSWHIAEVYQIPLGKPFLTIFDFYTLSLGKIGVTLFIILSGLVLELAHTNKSIKYSDFLTKRAFKIYPIYWGALIFGIITYLYRQQFLHDSITLFGELTIREWFCSFTGTCAFFGWWGGPFVVTGWFIGLIVSLYLLFPFLHKYFSKSKNQSLFATLILSLFFHLLIYFHLIGWGWSPQEWFPLTRIFEFSIGIWLARTIPSHWWTYPNHLLPNHKLWQYLADLSFPYFLVHFEFKFLFQALQDIAPAPITILIFLTVSTIVSHGILSAVSLADKLQLPGPSRRTYFKKTL